MLRKLRRQARKTARSTQAQGRCRLPKNLHGFKPHRGEAVVTLKQTLNSSKRSDFENDRQRSAVVYLSLAAAAAIASNCSNPPFSGRSRRSAAKLTTNDSAARNRVKPKAPVAQVFFCTGMKCFVGSIHS